MKNSESNYYCTAKNGLQLRAVKVDEKWRVCFRKDEYTWVFLDNNEYNSFEEAFEKYI